MWRIVRGELFRFVREPIFKIILAVSIAIVCTQIIPFRQFLAQFIDEDIVLSTVTHTGHNAFVEVKFDGFFTFFVPFLVVSIFTSEFTKKTIRNLGAINIPRRHIFVGKFISFAIIVLGLMLFLACFSTIIYTIFHGWGSNAVVSDISKILYYVLISTMFQVSYASAIILLSLYIFNDALIVLLYFGISLIESILASLVQGLSNHVQAIAYVFPSTYSFDLTNLPIESGKLIGAIISMGTYVIITLLIGSTIFKKRDISV